MQIVIHRGTHQIGGCATEIRTQSTRILIDFGSALPDSSGRTDTDTLKIEGINQGHPGFYGVFLTHYHGDHLGLIDQIPVEILIYMGRKALEIFAVYADRVKSGLAKVVGSIQSLDALVPVVMGDLTVTPISADHSAYGVFMYLVEGEGKRVLHTGDFRLHGFRGKATPKLLGRYARDVDVLITEGSSPAASVAVCPSGNCKNLWPERSEATNMSFSCVPLLILIDWPLFIMLRQRGNIFFVTAIRRTSWNEWLFARILAGISLRRL